MTARLRLGKLLARVSKAASFVPNSSEWMPKRVECRGNDPNLPGAGHGSQSDRAGFANVKPLDALPVMLFRVGGYSQSTTKSRQSAIGPKDDVAATRSLQPSRSPPPLPKADITSERSDRGRTRANPTGKPNPTVMRHAVRTQIDSLGHHVWGRTGGGSSRRPKGQSLTAVDLSRDRCRLQGLQEGRGFAARKGSVREGRYAGRIQ